MKKPKGILVNFNVKNLYHDGQETFVNKLRHAFLIFKA
ncbi:hypothetical protein J2799_002917 [Chryseobacterium vietnamense]|nr:hypothetical protein [Chryseobacterium vietnamense]